MPDITITITNKNLYKTSYQKNTTITIPPIVDITTISGGIAPYYGEAKITITKPDNTIDIISSTNEGGGGGGTYTFNNIGTYILRYSGYNVYQYINGDNVAHRNVPYSFYYSLAVIENRLPLKKWTITSVINRLLDVCEPIRRGEKPRFRLQGMKSDGTYEEGSQAEKFDKILAPQFSFTKQTLRECLQDIGKVVHGEPRLAPKKDENGVYYFEVSYELYASQEESGIYVRPSYLKTVSQAIDNYAAYLDSNAENLVNQLDKFGGVIVEPYEGGARSVRTENAYVRIEESNMLISTQFPIYTVDKLEYVYVQDGELKDVDITPWVFEKSVYDTQLSSYEEQYPYSKAYGLYFSQGNKNISGLNFKVDGEVFAAFKNYAIVNILRQATGNSALTISEYPKMCFRVTYTPFYTARVAQTKVNYKEFKYPAGLIYNQQANVIESRYYGENLKGAIARLGNVDLSLTYLLARTTQVPKAGQMYDKNYYISAVATEYLPTIIKCTIGLSRDFNRLSAYIGINSEKRYSEISQGQAVERNTLWREYIVVGNEETPDEDCYIREQMMFLIAATFTQPEGYNYMPITNVRAWGSSYQDNAAAAVSLPVISSAFGNSMSFSWEYEDNYSAGAQAAYRKNGEVDGYWQQSYNYTDYYGRLYYYDFDLQPLGEQPTAETLETLAQELPKGKSGNDTGYYYISTANKEPMILRKDNREALQCNFQIDFVTNSDIIIGSALASYCPAVRGSDTSLRARLYVLPTELNKFTDHLEAWEEVDLSQMPYKEVQTYITPNSDQFRVEVSGGFPADGKSWAIVTAQTITEGDDVEDEFGNVSREKKVTGGDLLIGRNIEVTAGASFPPVYFTKKREIFDKTVWKDRR